ncbi:hypothetical protein BpHYR1_052620 [Brachionus plicatilis]|uniref:Uncharacterized protein n=1 Tax=Brachionus plicatilis TaxID=10195 RepID=A0A3M7R5R1_BRAPC|nr:hypothetical protein BpHYR1_052620 [Brachionus plicatilis]
MGKNPPTRNEFKTNEEKGKCFGKLLSSIFSPNSDLIDTEKDIEILNSYSDFLRTITSSPEWYLNRFSNLLITKSLSTRYTKFMEKCPRPFGVCPRIGRLASQSIRFSSSVMSKSRVLIGSTDTLCRNVGKSTN